MFGQYSVRCILDQDVLLQEDVELIELLDPSLLTLGSSPSGSPRRANTLPRPSLIAKPSLWYATLKQTVENSLSQILNDFFLHPRYWISSTKLNVKFFDQNSYHMKLSYSVGFHWHRSATFNHRLKWQVAFKGSVVSSG